jgi:hypothetical protein
MITCLYDIALLAMLFFVFLVEPVRNFCKDLAMQFAFDVADT